MKQATSHLQGAITKVENAFPSIFTKDDVIVLLRELSDAIENDDDVANGGLIMDKDTLLDKIRGAVDNAINNMSNDEIVDTSDTEFNIRNGNEIEIESIGIHTSDIIDVVMREVDEVLDEVYEKIEEEN
jgi:hypothetical protein